MWSPSHKGVLFNETVNDIAKNACDVCAILNVDFTRDEAIRTITQELRKEWNTNFKEFSKTKGRAFFHVR